MLNQLSDELGNIPFPPPGEPGYHELAKAIREAMDAVNAQRPVCLAMTGSVPPVQGKPRSDSGGSSADPARESDRKQGGLPIVPVGAAAGAVAVAAGLLSSHRTHQGSGKGDRLRGAHLGAGRTNAGAGPWRVDADRAPWLLDQLTEEQLRALEPGMADYDTLKDVFDGDIDTWIDKKRLDLAFKVLDAAGTTVDVAEIVVAIGTLGLAAPVDAAALVPEGKMTAALAKALLEQLVKQAKEGAAREAAEKVEREAAEASARKFGGAAPGGPRFQPDLDGTRGSYPERQWLRAQTARSRCRQHRRGRAQADLGSSRRRDREQGPAGRQ